MKRQACSPVSNLPKKKDFKTSDHVGNKSKNLFSSFKCHIFPANFGSGRKKLFENIVLKHGGQLVSVGPSHIIVEDSVTVENVKKQFENTNMLESNGVDVVKCSWISACVKHQKLVEMETHLLYQFPANTKPAINPDHLLEKSECYDGTSFVSSNFDNNSEISKNYLQNTTDPTDSEKKLINDNYSNDFGTSTSKPINVDSSDNTSLTIGKLQVL